MRANNTAGEPAFSWLWDDVDGADEPINTSAQAVSAQTAASLGTVAANLGLVEVGGPSPLESAAASTLLFSFGEGAVQVALPPLPQEQTSLIAAQVWRGTCLNLKVRPPPTYPLPLH
jgi:hypothetical protein